MCCIKLYKNCFSNVNKVDKVVTPHCILLTQTPLPKTEISLIKISLMIMCNTHIFLVRNLSHTDISISNTPHSLSNTDISLQQKHLSNTRDVTMSNTEWIPNTFTTDAFLHMSYIVVYGRLVKTAYNIYDVYNANITNLNIN